MAAFTKLIPCCCIRPRHPSRPCEKHLGTDPGHFAIYQDNSSKSDLAEQIVAKLLSTDKNDASLKADIQSTVHIYGWYDGLAAAVLAAVEKAIRLREEIGPAMKAAFEKAVAGINMVEERVGEHPEMTALLVTFIALGILAVMTLWLVTWQGFAEEGIVE
ncbi:hypothetical protein LTS18_002097, partial [Coniosporium uncinatum]